MIQEQYSRISHHTISLTGTTGTPFTVPATEDFTNGSWTPFDLALSEIGVDEFQEKVFIRVGNDIKQICTDCASGATGTGTTSSGDYSFAIGSATTASGDYSFAGGINSVAGTGTTTFAFGDSVSAITDSSAAFGKSTLASGVASFASGYLTTASGINSHSEGFNTRATGSTSHAEGSGTTAGGDASHAQGSGTTAVSFASHAEGIFSLASGVASHAEGFQTLALGANSHAEGNNTNANGLYSHAGGFSASANLTAEWARSNTFLGQYGIVSLFQTTPNATPLEMFTNANLTSGRFTISNNSAYKVIVNLVCIDIVTGDAKEFGGTFLIKNIGGTTSFVGAPTGLVSTFGDASLATATAACTADNTNDAIIITVTGIAATFIDWFARMEYVKVL